MGASLTDYIRTHKPKPFSPRPYYIPEADAIVFLFRPDDHYGERVDDLLTVYRSLKTDEMVGCEIKGVKDRLKLLGNFGVSVRDGALHLALLFLAYMATTDAPSRPQYEQLGRVAKGMGAQIDPKELLPA